MAGLKMASSDSRRGEDEFRDLLVGELARILNVDPASIDRDRSFDEYGLDSTDAVVVVGLVEERLGIELAPELLLQHRTVNEVLRALAGKGQAKPGIDPEEEDAPVFMFPGCGGRDELGLVRFRAQCAPSLAFELVRIGDWREWVAQDLDFDDLVARVRAQIIARVPEGPLHFTGYSQGGQLAYASALALTRAGRPVRFVGLLDTFSGPALAQQQAGEGALKSIARRLASARDLLALAARYVAAQMWGGDGVNRAGGVRVRLILALWLRRPGSSRTRPLLRLLARHGRILFSGAGGVRLEVAIQLRVFSELWQVWCARNGEVPPLDSHVVLFRSDEPGAADFGWAASCPDLTIVPIGGNHETMFDPEHLDRLATLYAAALRGERGPVAPGMSAADHRERGILPPHRPVAHERLPAAHEQLGS